MPSVIEEVLPFDCENFNDFYVLSHNFVFMKLTLNIYDHGVVMHVKFYQVVISNIGVIAL